MKFSYTASRIRTSVNWILYSVYDNCADEGCAFAAMHPSRWNAESLVSSLTVDRRDWVHLKPYYCYYRPYIKLRYSTLNLWMTSKRNQTRRSVVVVVPFGWYKSHGHLLYQVESHPLRASHKRNERKNYIFFYLKNSTDKEKLNVKSWTTAGTCTSLRNFSHYKIELEKKERDKSHWVTRHIIRGCQKHHNNEHLSP